MASPTLDILAQASRDRISGTGDFGVASNTQSQQMVGLMLNVPLYTGGWRSAKLQEATHLHDKARAELARSRQQVAQMTRAAWQAVQSGQARLAALDAAHAASQARLDSTQLGRQVGDRTTLDLLNAQNDASAAKLAWLHGQIEILIAQLRLHAMAGQHQRPIALGRQNWLFAGSLRAGKRAAAIIVAGDSGVLDQRASGHSGSQRRRAPWMRAPASACLSASCSA